MAAIKRPVRYKPPDWLSGGTNVGQTYKAYSNYKQGTPDFGKDKGPGEPYSIVDKKVPTPPKGTPSRYGPGSGVVPQQRPQTDKTDARSEAIRRRLRGL